MKAAVSGICFGLVLVGCSGDPGSDDDASTGGTTDTGGTQNASGGAVAADGGSSGTGGAATSAGGVTGQASGGSGTGGAPSGGAPSGGAGGLGTGGAAGVGGEDGGTGVGGDASSGGGPGNEECTDVGAADNFSFFLTSWDGIRELAQSNDGFGGDLRWPAGETDGLKGADNICQELARRICHGDKEWRAYLSTSQVNAIDHIEGGPWYDFTGAQVASSKSDLTGGGGTSGSCGGTNYQAGDRLDGGAGGCGTYDELGILHDGGAADIDGDGSGQDDDHDTMTATLADGTYAGFSCEDWTSTTATSDGGGGQGGPGGFGGGVQMGHSWPAMSGVNWSEAHAGHQCAAGTNFVQDGFGDGATVGGGGGYGGFYCFAITSE